MKNYHIVVLPGDGIDPGVTAAVAVLKTACPDQLTFSEQAVGAGEYLRFGSPFPESAFSARASTQPDDRASATDTLHLTRRGCERICRHAFEEAVRQTLTNPKNRAADLGGKKTTTELTEIVISNL